MVTVLYSILGMMIRSVGTFKPRLFYCRSSLKVFPLLPPSLVRNALVGPLSGLYDQPTLTIMRWPIAQGTSFMSIDKSLRRKNQLVRARNVLTRGERIKILMDEERWKEGQGPYNLPKVKVVKM